MRPLFFAGLWRMTSLVLGASSVGWSMSNGEQIRKRYETSLSDSQGMMSPFPFMNHAASKVGAWW
jgi:hypothetical protein